MSAAALAPVKVWALAVFGPVPGRRFVVAAVTCPAGCGVHLHRIGAARSDGYVRRAKCGAVYIVLTAAEDRRAA